MLCKGFWILIFAIVAGSVYGQDDRAQGYVGATIGASFLGGHTEEYSKPGVGLNITLINFGYTLHKRFGVTAMWSGGAHRYQSLPPDGLDEEIHWETSYGMLMAGPMYTFNLSDNAWLDLKARVGTFWAIEQFERKQLYTSRRSTSSLGYSFGVTYRHKFAGHWCALLSSDYSTVKAGDLFSFENHFAALNISAGIGFLFY